MEYTKISQAQSIDTNSLTRETISGSKHLAWSSFVFAALEAVCVVYVAAAKAGFVLLSASIASGFWASFLHRDILRIPLLGLALAGSGVNLYLLWNARRLRNAPAAAWRKQPRSTLERWRIRVVLWLSLATIAFVAGEVYFHRLLHHTVL